MSNKTNFVVEPDKQEVVVTRELDAPRDLVFQAMTDATSIARWWGPAFLKTTAVTMDVKPGGAWRFIQIDLEGNEFAFHGVYHSVSPGCIVSTLEWEALPGHVLLESVVLEEHDGKTLVTNKSVYQSQEDRDNMVAAGMEMGAVESMDRLEALLASLKPHYLSKETTNG